MNSVYIATHKTARKHEEKFNQQSKVKVPSEKIDSSFKREIKILLKMMKSNEKSCHYLQSIKGIASFRRTHRILIHELFLHCLFRPRISGIRIFISLLKEMITFNQFLKIPQPTD